MAGTLVAAALVVGMLASVWQAERATTAESIAQKERSKAERFAKTEAEARALAVDQTRLANDALGRSCPPTLHSPGQPGLP